LQTLLAAGASDLLPRQRLVLGGETLPWSLVEQIVRVHPHPACRLYNHYGPTEATIGALVYPLSQADLQFEGQGVQGQGVRGRSVPIGYPLPNVQALLLDANLQPVPMGVAAELYLGGKGLAAGYLHQPQVSQERFLTDVMAGQDQEQRLYR